MIVSKVDKRALQNSLSWIHIVPDNWTSLNSLGVIGFTVYFMTEDHDLQSLVMGIKNSAGSTAARTWPRLSWSLYTSMGLLPRSDTS